MTNGQIAQLQELSKCYFPHESYAISFVWAYNTMIEGLPSDMLKTYLLTKWQKAYLRRLTHQYRHQIRAMKRNKK
jgi:uncharacterized membrane protein